MNMRKKPTPSPIARPSDVGLAPRPLSPARPRAVLPTVAALLAMAAIGCEQSDLGGEAIKRDENVVAIGNTLTQNVTESVTKAPRHHDPSEPLPALGIIEQAPPPPPPPAPPAPTTHPYPVKGGMKAVHPPKRPPMTAGTVAPVMATPPPPIVPLKKPVKLSGDSAAVFPETT